MKKILVLGATSAMAKDFCRSYLQREGQGKVHFYLVARNQEKLESVKKDLELRGSPCVRTACEDLDLCERHENLMERAFREFLEFDIVLLAHGILGDHEKAMVDFTEARRILETNYLSPVSLLTIIALKMEQQKHGIIAAISSVAGDRGRVSNYIYGSAKSGLSTYLSGLRQRLYKKGVRVIDIRPGLTDTPMTYQFKKGPLWATSHQVAVGMLKAIEKKGSVVYLPFYWRPIMWVIRIIPQRIFNLLQF